MLTHQVSSSRSHSSFIEWIPNPAHAIGLDRRPRPAVQDDVAIGSRERAVAGMEGVRDFAGPENADLRRQIRGRAQNPAALGARGLRIEMDHLHGGVHAGIVRHMRVTRDGNLILHQSSTNRIILMTPARKVASR